VTHPDVECRRTAAPALSERTVDHDGQRVRSASYRIVVDESLDWLHNLQRSARPGRLRKQYELGPDRPVSFHPKQCAHEIINVCTWAEKTDDRRLYAPLLDEVLGELMAHRIEQADRTFFVYPFPYEALGKRLAPPWVSALAQAFAAGALVRAYRLTRDAGILELARRTVRAMSRLRGRVGQPELWVTFVDENGYLWFEEYPSDRDPQTRVLNGQIYAIMGLYSYHRLEPTRETMRLMQAGIATVRRYFDGFRQPGGVNRYSLLPGSPADYLPARSVMQQAWLARVTGDATLVDQWRAFERDMGSPARVR
jgi:hypothetical protein